MKKFTIIFIIFLSCFLLVSCSSNNVSQNTTATPKEQKEANIEFVDYNHYSELNFYYIEGVLINNGESPAEQVEVKAIFYDENNKLLFLDKSFADPYNLLPEQKATFKILFPLKTFHHFEMKPVWK